ncbi:MAG: type I-C CRISPR-associated protein Cas7/Csd2 [Fimbriimonadia bacterium]|jgi:CRISPR-associated protein Csd2
MFNLQEITDPGKRYDFLLLFDVTDGNPNGDPDAGNLPRVDPETMQGIVTDVCLKRKIRNFVELHFGADAELKVYVRDSGVALNEKHERAYKSLSLTSTGSKQSRADANRARDWMCANYYDIRMFGAVMTTGVNCGQVRGPVQLTFARSVDPVAPQDVSITRVAVTRKEDADVAVSDAGETRGGKETEMGRKALVPYGLYLGKGFYSPALAAQTGVSREDLELFWRALVGMFEHDRSAARGYMEMHGIYVFRHDNPLGNAPSGPLFSRLRVQRRPEVQVARRFDDYVIDIVEANMPEGVTLVKLLG